MPRTVRRGHRARARGRAALFVTACCVGLGASSFGATSQAGATSQTGARGAGVAALASAQPGVRLSFGDKALATANNVMGGQVVLTWSQIEPKNGTFCWNNPRTTAAGCGTTRNNVGSGLDAQLAYFQKIGKEATVQVNSPTKPTWVYVKGSGVEKCGVMRVPQGAGTTSQDIPMYWRSDGSLNTKYFTMMSNMIASLTKAISTSPYASVVAGVRVSPNLVGTEYRAASGGAVRLATPRCSAQNAWTTSIGANAYAYVMKMNYTLLEQARIRPILRENAFTTLGAANLDPSKYLVAAPGTVQPWYFMTSSSPDMPSESKDPFDYAWARSGLGIAYDEAVWSSDVFPNPVSWNYWNVLMNLDRGTSYVAVFGKDLARAQTDPEYAAAFEFANRYAGWNTPAGANASPGAWIALAPNPGEITAAPTRSLTNGDLGMFMSEDNTDGSTERDSLGPLAECRYDTTNKLCGGVNMIGSPTQRFGRWARETSGPDNPSIRLNLDDTFKNSLDIDGDLAAYVTYLDCGGGTWALDWGGGVSQSFSKGGSADCSSSTDQWVTAGPIFVPVDEINRSVDAMDDFGLTATGGNTVFHMLEVRRVQ